MHKIRGFWTDEYGSVISAELVTIGTVATIGAVVGLREVSNAVNEELQDVSNAIRSLDQSYSIRGMSGCASMTAGSTYIDRHSSGALPQLRDTPEKPIPPNTSNTEPAISEWDSKPLWGGADSPLNTEGSATPAADKL